MRIRILIMLFFPIFVFSQVKKNYPNGETKITFDTINQMIDGDFRYFYSNGILKAKGHFSNNQKTGTWEFFSSNGKLLLKRTYLNNFRFETEENIQPLKLNGYNYWPINDYDILYQDTFLTLIEHSPVNDEFFQNSLLLKEIKKYILSENSTIYNDDKFSKIINFKDSFPSVDSLKNIKHYVFKEIVFYDIKHQIINRRVLAIMPVNIKNGNIIPLFSIYEPQFREFTKNQILLNKLFNNQYYGEVIKIYNENKDSLSQGFTKLSPSFSNENISWFDIKKPFDLEAFYLEKEVNNNLRMKIEPDLYINSNDSLNIINKKRKDFKNKFQ